MASMTEKKDCGKQFVAEVVTQSKQIAESKTKEVIALPEVETKTSYKRPWPSQ